MATTYPGTKQTFTDPAGTNTLDSPDHAGLHTDKNDTIEAIEDVLGTTAGTSVLKDFSAGDFAAVVTKLPAPNLLKNGNFINNSTNGYGATPDDWTNSSANPVQGGFPSFTKQQLIDLLGITDGNIEGLWNLTEASGNAIDLSSNAYNLTDTNTVTSTDDGLMGKARTFTSASNEYFTISHASSPNLAITGSMTMVAFVKPATVKDQMPISKTDASNGYYLNMGANNTIQVSCRGLATTPMLTADVKYEANKWYMIVGVYDSANSKIKIWVNGVKKEATASGSITTFAGAFQISGFNGTSNVFNGDIQNAMVLSTALSDAQVKRLWAFTSYKGQKIRRATSDGYIYQTLPQDLVERLRGKDVTVVADMYQDTASTGQISIYDGSETASDTTATTGSWVEVSATATISSTATEITIRLKASTSDSNVWFRKVRVGESAGTLPYSHSGDDWARFPRLLQLDPPAVVSGYEFEENKWFNYTPTITGFSSDPTGVVARFKINRTTCSLTFWTTGSGTSNSTSFSIAGGPVDITSIRTYTPALVKNNGTWEDGIINTSAGNGSLTVRRNGLASFTSSGAKDAYFNIEYQIG